MIQLLVLIGLILVGPIAEARVFKFSSESFAAYFRGTIGDSRLERTAYEGGSDTTATPVTFVGDEHLYNFSGELGFLYNFGEFMIFRIGAEVLQSRESELVGNNAAGTKLYDLQSDIFVFNPMATIEYYLSSTGTFRFGFFGGAGIANVSMDNEYTFTDAGRTAYSSIADYTEKSDALLVSAHYGALMEVLFVDTVTAMIEVGFRHMPIPELEHKHDTATLIGNVTQGSPVLDNDGSNRTLDLSGYYIGLSFRFFIDIM